MQNDPVRNLLVDELENRRLRNSSYSLRALARDLGVSLTALSDVMNGKRRLSKKNIETLARALLLSPAQIATLLDAKAETSAAEKPESYEILSDDVFRMIADWYYFAILNLAKLPNASSSPSWIAERLGIELETAREALNRLERLEFITRQGGKLTRTARLLETTRDIPSTAIRKHHLGNLQLAEEALLQVPVDEREYGSVIMPVNMGQMRTIKKYLSKVGDRVATMAETGKCSEVYVFGFQFFPVSKHRRRPQ